MEELKKKVKSHWEQETCGMRYGQSSEKRRFFEETARAKYRLEPYIARFADFANTRNQSVLEIGVGGGADFQQWVEGGNFSVGIDLTLAGIKNTRERFDAFSIAPERFSLFNADAEQLPFKDSSFDSVYSWGVLHHSPNTSKCLAEAYRVLKPGGTLKAMIYHRPSWTGLMLWVRYALLTGRFWLTEKDVVYKHLESPGTKAYTRGEAKALLRKTGFEEILIETKLSGGDTLSIEPGEKYTGLAYRLIWKFYPTRLIKSLGDRLGVFLLMKARKPVK